MQQFLDFLNTLLYGPFLYTQSHHFATGWMLLTVAVALLIEVTIIHLMYLLAIGAFRRARPFLAFVLQRFGVGKHEVTYTFLQLTFPADTARSADATKQLHIHMRSLVKYHSFGEKLAGRKQPYSLELVASRDDGIRYVIRIPKTEVEVVRRNLISFLPGMKVSEVKDYTSELSQTSVGAVELALKSDFILPLADNKTLTEHDPIAYLAGQMRSLAAEELVAFQIVAVPVLPNTHHIIFKRIAAMRRRIAAEKEVSSQLDAHQVNIVRLSLKVLAAPIFALTVAVKLVVSFIDSLLADGTSESWKDDTGKRATIAPHELKLGATIKTKIDQPLFEVSMRVLVVSASTDTINSRMDAIVSSFQTFSSPLQVIRVRKDIPFVTSNDTYLSRFKERTLSPHTISQPTILSSSELSDLYHFPDTDLTKTEGLVKSRSRDLPTPLSLKGNNAKLDVIVGMNEFDGELSPIGMTLDQRERHTYVIGKTGTGKTTLLTSSIYQDMLSGKGLAVLDPHGDMFQELLAIVPEDRRDDVVVFDPSDDQFPVGLNILDPGIEFDNDDIRRDKITSSVLSVFKKLADESQWGPRMAHILRNTTMTALHLPNPSLYTLQLLLTDRKYQRSVAKTLKDPVLRQFWDKEFATLGSMQMATVTAPLTHRLGQFITSKTSRHILLQKESTIRVADIMDKGKILLANLSKGDIGEDKSQFFGTILTSFIWMAAYQRTKIPEKQRRNFFLYVDEFQNFASPDFSDIVSEGRKYHIGLIVSHQSIAQIEDKSLVKLIAGNASTLICLKVSPEDEAFILPYMKTEVKMGDIVNLAPYHFYMKTTSDGSEDAFSGMTVSLDVEPDDATRETVIAQSQEQYGMTKAKVEAYMVELFSVDNPPPVQEVKLTARRRRNKGTATPKEAEVTVVRKVHGG